MKINKIKNIDKTVFLLINKLLIKYGFSNILAALTWLILFLPFFIAGVYKLNFLSLFISFLILIILPIYYLLVLKDSKQRNRRAMEKLNDTLMKDEKIIHKGIDKRICTFSRRSICSHKLKDN